MTDAQALPADLSFEDAIRREFRIVSRIPLGHDFFEGIRALVIDKDRAPRWNPATLGAVDEALLRDGRLRRLTSADEVRVERRSEHGALRIRRDPHELVTLLLSAADR